MMSTFVPAGRGCNLFLRSYGRSHRAVICVATLIVLVVYVSGCATPVGVKHVDQERAYRTLDANILSSGKPSAYSRQLLERHALVKKYDDHPAQVINELYSGLGKPDERDRLFALSELSFAYAENEHDRSYYLASAVFAYAFLFPDDEKDAPSAYDPRLRLAVDLYNQGLSNGLATEDQREVDLSQRELKLPFGALDLQVDPQDFRYGGYQLTKFVSLSDLEIRGLRDRYRDPGIGAPLSAKVEPLQTSTANRWIPTTSKVPVTAFVRFDDPRRGMSEGKIHGTLHIYDPDKESIVRIGSYAVPLESDSSAALAYRLEGAPLWDFEIAGFRKGDFSLAGKSNDYGLFMLHPYMPGLIPVVFVHGTASSPARWAEMANELLGDPNIASHYQLWFFVYNSGNPIALSALKLRESLTTVVKDVDPDGKDQALQQMVVIGHSQGGLLTKMMVVDSGSRFWDRRFKVPFEQAKLDPETRDLLQRGLFVKPLPFVKEVVFIATPHRGSYMASNFVVKFFNKFLNLPGGMVKAATQLNSLREPGIAGGPFKMPTALDNMDSSNPFVQTLSGLPIAPGVRAHSIIPVKGDGPPEEGNDGVVKYKSAHIEGVESELIVRSGHSTQATPETIEEVRRILYEHAGIH
jgi:pimeloyl-ACP methyl ester carboxylesterase